MKIWPIYLCPCSFSAPSLASPPHTSPSSLKFKCCFLPAQMPPSLREALYSIVPFCGWDSVLTSFMTITHPAARCRCVCTRSYPLQDQKLPEDRVLSKLLSLYSAASSALLGLRKASTNVYWLANLNEQTVSKKCLQETFVRKSKTTASLWISGK